MSAGRLAILVVVESDLYGTSFAIAHDLSPSVALLEMCYVPPLGTGLIVRFVGEHGTDIVARVEVTGFRKVERDGWSAERLTGVRFLEFIEHDTPATTERIQ